MTMNLMMTQVRRGRILVIGEKTQKSRNIAMRMAMSRSKLSTMIGSSSKSWSVGPTIQLQRRRNSALMITTNTLHFSHTSWKPKESLKWRAAEIAQGLGVGTLLVRIEQPSSIPKRLVIGNSYSRTSNQKINSRSQSVATPRSPIAMQPFTIKEAKVETHQPPRLTKTLMNRIIRKIIKTP